MQTIALRLYGANDLRLEAFSLPAITEDEILMRVFSDTVCASTYKAVKQGSGHKRVPENVATNPIIIGHEMCGEVIEVGRNLTDAWHKGDKVIVQPALKLENLYDPGYSYEYIGGNATYVIVPKVVLDRGCLIPYRGDSYYKGSLVESIGCVLRGFKGLYHEDPIDCTRINGPKKGGKTAILGGAGPMGLACAALAASYGEASMVVVTDINGERLADAAARYTPDMAWKNGCDLRYVNTADMEDPAKTLRALTGGTGFDDVFVMVPVPGLFTMAETVAGIDGCVNFFAGPADHGLMGSLNLYRIHYDGVHVVGTAGSTTQDTWDTIRLIENGILDPSIMVSHIMGLNAAKEAVFAMEHPSGAKKVCYSSIDLPIVALSEFEERGKQDPMFAELDRITKAHGGLWSEEAEQYLLEHAPQLKL
ncbi:MAG: zinc-binding dehydrogenase [Clostridia bacterium]|nr:zinc-binding dehydrogenase [Clostridia bacterium]